MTFDAGLMMCGRIISGCYIVSEDRRWSGACRSIFDQMAGAFVVSKVSE